VVGGRYQLHTMLRRGGGAAVWAGIDTRLDRPVAVKVLDGYADPLVVRWLDREGRTVAKLAHPNIVVVYDVGTEGGVPFLVMELVQGSDLQRRLAHNPLHLALVVHVAIQMCGALEAAHAAGVVHGDIKPENILLTAAGSVKLCDFGIAQLQPVTTASGSRSSTAVGTAEYMAPEQAAGGTKNASIAATGRPCTVPNPVQGRKQGVFGWSGCSVVGI
jgi:eukaryotic-like serine/threonine-protein kinase